MSEHKETFGPFDAADYLITFEDVAAYLEAVIEERRRRPHPDRSGLGRDRPLPKPQRDRPPSRNQPRRSLQGTLGREATPASPRSSRSPEEPSASHPLRSRRLTATHPVRGMTGRALGWNTSRRPPSRTPRQKRAVVLGRPKPKATLTHRGMIASYSPCYSWSVTASLSDPCADTGCAGAGHAESPIHG